MHKHVIEQICSLEQTLDTQSLLYGDVNYWPLCRLRLWSLLIPDALKSTAPKADVISNAGPVFSDVGQVSAFPFDKPELGFIHTDRAAASKIEKHCLPNPDLLFFARPEEYRDQVAGSAFAKMLDSIYERATAYRHLKIELSNPRTMALKRYHDSAFLHAPLITHLANFDPPRTLTNFELLERELKHIGFDNILTAKAIATDMGKIFYHARIFEVALRAIRPKIILLSVYYHSVGMGLMLAARRLNITTVDVQHGRLGPHHGLYTQLTAAPKQGYDLLPDHIWCWGSQTKCDIEVDKANGCSRHGGLVGGNPWLDRWLLSGESAAMPSEAPPAKPKGQKRILVSLQPWDTPLPDFVLDAMAQSPENWEWWLRLHPLRRHTEEELSDLLHRRGIQNANISDATDRPLFALLKTCDHHVTAFSSVAVEALAFGLRTTLFTETGRQVFSKYVETDTFDVAVTAGSLLTSIHAGMKVPPPREDKPFIDNRPGLAETALASILSNSDDGTTLQ